MIDVERYEGVARLGFAARGLVYLLVGWFALRAARSGGQPTDNQAALASLVDEPLGRVLLAVIALGLLGYGIWRLLEAWLDLDGHGSETKGLFVRGGHGISGVAHALLAAYAASLALRGDRGSGGQGETAARDWTAWLLAQPFGEMLVGLIGAALIATGLFQLRKAYRADFTRHLSPGVPAMRWLVPMGRLGFAARGVVFMLIGLFFLTAARQSDPNEAGGMGQALREIQTGPNGPLLLGVVALGLLLFGLFSLIEARYRRLGAGLHAGNVIGRAL